VATPIRKRRPPLYERERAAALLRMRPRSVLTGKFAGEEDGDVERDRFTGALRRGVLAGPSCGVAAECVESAGVLRGTRDSAEGFRQLASEVQSREVTDGPLDATLGNEECAP
jgi:hypothetical protein